MLRKIIEINESKCNGCGLCVSACHEGAIEMVNGKAKLVSDEYCDGLGDCLPECPTGAITIVEREAAAFDEELVKKRMKDQESKGTNNTEVLPCGCPGTEAKEINKEEEAGNDSELRQWPVQLELINPNASYLKDADILIAADCTAYAYGSFHKDFIKGRVTIIGCPKLDDNEYYREKLGEIFKNNKPKSITVVRMEVPCCSGIIHSLKEAMLSTKTIVPYNEVVISTDGRILG